MEGHCTGRRGAISASFIRCPSGHKMLCKILDVTSNNMTSFKHVPKSTVRYQVRYCRLPLADEVFRSIDTIACFEKKFTIKRLNSWQDSSYVDPSSECSRYLWLAQKLFSDRRLNLPMLECPKTRMILLSLWDWRSLIPSSQIRTPGRGTRGRRSASLRKNCISSFLVRWPLRLRIKILCEKKICWNFLGSWWGLTS